MASQLTQRERMMLQDHLKHEEVCIRKYRGRAGQVSMPAVRSMFNELAQDEQDHYDALSRLLESRPGAWVSTARQLLFGGERGVRGSGPRGPHWGGMLPGDTPDVNHGDLTRGGLDRRGVNLAGIGSYGEQEPRADDASMLTDMLMTEKLVSGAYGTAIFESTDPQVRQTLQRIQHDEHKHGELLARQIR